MQYHIFFDTNTLLSFYKKLKPQVIKDIQKHTEYNNIIPVLTNQVIDEFWRNRSKVLNELFLKSEVNSQVRANLKVYENCFVEDINTFADLKLKEKEFNTLHNKFIKDFEKNKNDHNFTADKLINNIFKKAIIFDFNDEIYNISKQRFDLGCPPGKGNRYCDMVSWQTLLSEVKKYNVTQESGRIKKIYFCTSDTDYLDYTDYLIKEWKEKTELEIDFITFDYITTIMPNLDQKTKKALNAYRPIINSLPLSFDFSKINLSLQNLNNIATNSLNPIYKVLNDPIFLNNLIQANSIGLTQEAFVLNLQKTTSQTLNNLSILPNKLN